MQAEPVSGAPQLQVRADYEDKMLFRGPEPDLDLKAWEMTSVDDEREGISNE